MKKTTKDILTNRISDLMVDFWLGLLDVVDPGCSFDEMSNSPNEADAINALVTEKVVQMMDINGLLTDGEHFVHFKPTAIYTGGGIWLCGMWLNDHEYAVVSNEYELELSFYNYDDDVKEGYTIAEHGDFPCMGFIRSVSVEDMTDFELLKVWKPIAEELHRNAY